MLIPLHLFFLVLTLPWSHHDPCQHLCLRHKILSVLISPGLLFTLMSMYWGLPCWRSTWMGSYIGEQWLGTSGNSIGWKYEYEGFFVFLFFFFLELKTWILRGKTSHNSFASRYQAIEKTPQTHGGEQRKTFLQKDTGRMEPISSRKHRSREMGPEGQSSNFYSGKSLHKQMKSHKYFKM